MPLPKLERPRGAIPQSPEIAKAVIGPASQGVVSSPDTDSTDVHAAILTMRHALAGRSGSSDEWLALGESFLAIGSDGPAQDAFGKALSRNPRNLAARLHLIRLLSRKGFCLEAATLCWDAPPENKGSTALTHALAAALARIGLPRQAGTFAVQASLHADPHLQAPPPDMDAVVQAPCHVNVQKIDSPACRATDELLLRWGTRLSSWQGLKVGLAWGARGDDALLESVPLAQFEPLGSIPGVVFFSIQQHPTGEETCPPIGMELVTLADVMTSAEDLDAVIMQMDLVISTDATLAARAAFLGRPVWQLQSTARRLTSGPIPESSSLRVFQQDRHGSWASAMQETANALLEFVNKHADAKLDQTQKRLLQAHIAIIHHRLPDAERIYRELLAAQAPTRSLLDALRLYLDRSERHHATDFILASIDGVPHHMLDWLLDLRAHALLKQGKQDDAFGLWDRVTSGALPLLPVLINYAKAAHAARNWERATGLWQKAMRLYPDSPQAALGAAFTYAESENADMAIACFRRGLAMAPINPTAHHKLGCLLQAKGEEQQALQHMQKALCLDPGHAWGWEYLGYAFYQLKNYHAAAACLQQVISIKPTSYACSHLGFCAYMLKLPEAALAPFDQALEMNPKDTEVMYFKGMCLDQLERYEAALATLETLRTHNPEAFDKDDVRRKNLFLLYLKLQDSDRIPLPDVNWSVRRFQNMRWTGQPLQGKTLLVFQDAGFGDSIQAARFYHHIKQEFAPEKLKLVVWPELMRLYKGLRGVDEVLSNFANDVNNTPCDYFIDEYSLFLVLGKKRWSCETGAYLHAEQEAVNKWRSSFNDDHTFRIGLVWGGNPAHPNDAQRSTRLEEWAPLGDIPGLSIYALQKGAAVDQAFAASAINVVTPGSVQRDFADTAALMAALDLVISVDSAPAHLAGALGVPVWVMLPATGLDWRWVGQENKASWYSDMRLFRPAKDQDRSEVILRIRDELQRLVAQHRMEQADCATR